MDDHRTSHLNPIRNPRRGATRCGWGVWLALLAACSPPLVAQESTPSFPYQALVNRASATVRSGPGEVHYGTQALEAGEVVEVYRHDPGGWAAIRPLASSFSLIPQSSCTLVEEGIAQIDVPQTRAWVGTQLGAVDQPLWQVKLDPGERVQVLGELSWPQPEGHSTEWYQIAPPAGEFRWIALADLRPLETALPQPDGPALNPANPPAEAAEESATPSTTVAIEMPAGTSQAPATDSRSMDMQVAQAGHQQPIPSMSDNAGWRKSTRPIERFPVTGTVAEIGPRHGLRFAEATANDRSLATQLSLSNLETDQTLTSGPLPPLAVLEQRLTAEMLKSPNQWDLAQLRMAATQLASQSVDASQQLGAQRLLAKVIECQRLQAAMTGQISTGTSAPAANRSLLTVPGGEPAAAGESTFDAVGWLNELKQQNGAAPSTFVLQNDAGKITHHLQPIPGLNLTRYLRSRIGVVGQRGFNQRLGLNHITVQRVYPLASEQAAAAQQAN